MDHFAQLLENPEVRLNPEYSTATLSLLDKGVDVIKDREAILSIEISFIFKLVTYFFERE